MSNHYIVRIIIWHRIFNWPISNNVRIYFLSLCFFILNSETVIFYLLELFFFMSIRFLGLNEQSEIPESCQSAFDVSCLRMEERLAYSNTEQVYLVKNEIQFLNSPN